MPTDLSMAIVDGVHGFPTLRVESSDCSISPRYNEDGNWDSESNKLITSDANYTSDNGMAVRRNLDCIAKYVGNGDPEELFA